MSKRVTTYLVAAVAAAATLALAAGVASASSQASARSRVRVVPIVMHDPGCHWFRVGGKLRSRLVVQGKTAFRNLDEAALTFKGAGSFHRLAVGKTLTIATRGVYHIRMVGQPSDDNTLVLVVK